MNELSFQYWSIYYSFQLWSELLPYTETICENRHGELACEEDKTILVYSAYYGRHDEETCPHINVQTTECNADRLDFVREQ